MHQAGDKCPKCGGVLSEHDTIKTKTRKVERQIFRCQNAKCGYSSDSDEAGT